MNLLMDGREALRELETIDETALIDTMHRAAALCIRGEGIDPEQIEVSLSFVSPEEIHRLNREYRGVDRVTDVLSFPLAEDLDELPALEEDGADGIEEATCATDAATVETDDVTPAETESAGSTDGEADCDEEALGAEDWLAPLGDVVICLDQARAQAEEYGHSQQREIVYLFVHSILHLLGYDHMEEAEKKEMRAREEEVMEALQIRRA